MDINIELQDTDAKFSLFAASTYELTFGGLSVHMNADQFQQLCENLRPWVVEDTTPQPGAEALRELQSACEPFIRHNSSEQFIDLRVPTSAVTRLRGLLESLLARGEP